MREGCNTHRDASQQLPGVEASVCVAAERASVTFDLSMPAIPQHSRQPASPSPA